MEMLLSIDAVTSDKNVHGLCRLHDDVESHVRSLKALGIQPDSYGAMLVPVLRNKLPPEMRLIISRKNGSSEPSVDQLLEYVEEELMAREHTTHEATPPPAHRQDRSKHTATALLASTPRSITPSCCYCQQSHLSRDCTSITAPSTRKQSLRASGRCFNCLAWGHLSRNCHSTGRCFKCKGRHHTSVCESQRQATSTSSQSSGSIQPSPATGSALNPSAPSFATSSNNFCASSIKSVLLQTARAYIYNLRPPGHSVEIRLLLDGGSQKSYLSERARRILELDPVEEQQLSIATFGSS